MKALQERDLSGHDIVAIVIDGKTFAEDDLIKELKRDQQTFVREAA